VAALLLIRSALSGWFVGSFVQRVLGLAAIVGGGMLVYFPLAWILGATDKEGFRSVLRRRRPYTDAG
jgi:putative peptidoglycan lipid II flippase